MLVLTRDLNRVPDQDGAVRDHLLNLLRRRGRDRVLGNLERGSATINPHGSQRNRTNIPIRGDTDLLRRRAPIHRTRARRASASVYRIGRTIR